MYTFENVVALNQKIADTKAGFLYPEKKNEENLKKIINTANLIKDPYESAAYFALTVYRDQPFKDANTRVGASAIYEELLERGKPVSHKVEAIKEWMTKHEIDNLKEPKTTEKNFSLWLQQTS